MFITNILLKKAKSKQIMVLMESVVSGHQFTSIRERLGEKLELKAFDPYTPKVSTYKISLNSFSRHTQTFTITILILAAVLLAFSVFSLEPLIFT